MLLFLQAFPAHGDVLCAVQQFVVCCLSCSRIYGPQVIGCGASQREHEYERTIVASILLFVVPLLSCCCCHLQGVDGWDVDLPTMLEANFITSFVAKVLWVFVYIAVYGLRPVIIRPKPIGETPAILHGPFECSC